MFFKITKFYNLLAAQTFDIQISVHSFDRNTKTGIIIRTIAIGALHVVLPDAVSAKCSSTALAFLRFFHYIFADQADETI
jgi:hypothetical protein